MNVMRENGVVMVVWEAKLPSPGPSDVGTERIAAFYKRLEEEMATYAARLLESAKEEYLASSEPRKRFTFPPYRLTLYATVTEEGEEFFSATRVLHLSRAGRVLVMRQAAELFLRHTGRLCPPILLRLRGYRIPRGRGDLYRENGTFYRLSPSPSACSVKRDNSSS